MKNWIPEVGQVAFEDGNGENPLAGLTEEEVKRIKERQKREAESKPLDK